MAWTIELSALARKNLAKLDPTVGLPLGGRQGGEVQCL